MGYPIQVVEQGRKLVAEGKAIEDVRTTLGKHVSQKTYEKWLDEARSNRPKVEDLVSMIQVQFDRLDVIGQQQATLQAEESEIRSFLKTFNISERPQTTQAAA